MIKGLAWISVLFIILFLLSFNAKEEENTNKCKEYIYVETKKIIEVLDQSLACLDSSKDNATGKRLKELYFLSRRHYKHIECFVEYYSPHDAKYFINGPLVNKSEIEYGKKIYEPRGLQVVEELLFDADTIDRKALKFEYSYLKESFKSLNTKVLLLSINEGRLFDMVQFELYRITCLNLNGYDATITKINPLEGAWSLEGCSKLISLLQKPNNKEKYTKLTSLFNTAKKYNILNKNNDTFNRLYFTTRLMTPLYKEVVQLRRKLQVDETTVNYALNLGSSEMFGENMFNSLYFSVNTKDTANNVLQANLGKILFYDPALSGNNKRACASCHQSNKGFADGLAKAVAFNKDSMLSRNTPSLLNVMYQRNFFLDGRSRQLEQQINDVLHNKNEMNTTVEEIILKLNTSKEYKELFKSSFAGTTDTAIGYYGILKAITEYEKTLTSLDTRFDKYLRGDYTKLSAAEINGYNLFSGKAQCGTCHFLPLFNGLVPPYFNDTEYEIIGVPVTKDNKEVDKDEGRKKISLVSIHQYAFKTTTVRNAAITAPYMHNGVYSTVDEVLDFYNKGGGNGLGFNLPNQTLPFDSLRLTKKELNEIKSFMLSLTDTTKLTTRPVRLPEFESKVMNTRKVGGEY